MFTLPAEIAPIACQNKAVVYDRLFRAAAETLLTIAADPWHLGARIGATAVLHSWGSAMVHHPHVHMIVPGCQTASNRDPGSASKRDPHRPWDRLVPVANRRGPARVAQCLHERRSGVRGRCLFAHRGKPGWHSGAVFEAPALVAGFDDFVMVGQAV